MIPKTGESMGELVNLAEYKAQKETQEIEKLKSDVKQLMGELKDLRNEAMHPVLGPLLWPEDFRDRWMPEIDTLLTALDGYDDGREDDDDDDEGS